MRMQRVLQHILWPGHFKVSNTQCVLVCVCVDKSAGNRVWVYEVQGGVCIVCAFLAFGF